ncbi:MAG TPA: PAS domain-containing protein, partial [Lentibacillus sp.]
MIHVEIVESIPVPTIVMNKHNMIISYNHLMEASLGKNIKTGTNLYDNFTVSQTDNNPRIITAASGSNQFIFMCNPLSDSENTLLIGLEISALSELKTENKELKNLNRELDAIIENSYDGIYITDSRGVTWKTNSAIERITGIP